MKKYSIKCGSHSLELGGKTAIMGILNITPDSFSDGGEYIKPENALKHAMQMVEDGADIIDIGGESTRPFAEPVSEEEETRRVVPVVEALAGRIPVPVSIDTTKAAVARRAVDAGASIINDISALRSDPEMTETAVKLDIPVILMHMKGTPGDMQVSPEYDDVITEVRNFLAEAVENTVKAGLPKSKIIVDPGIGFGKTLRHNLLIMKNIDRFLSLGVPLLIGSSRKSFIRQLLSETDKALPVHDPAVETGTQASVAAAALYGAHIVRVHNVARTRATLAIADAISRGGA